MAAPERFAEKSDLLLQRGHRQYMACTSQCCRVGKNYLPKGRPMIITQESTQFDMADWG